MTPSSEQRAIIQCHGNACINAGAGSGKTTTLVQYASEHPQQAILYQAFNRSSKLEAVRKFAHLPHVTIETAHSLAYRAIVTPRRYTVQTQHPGYNQLVTLLGIHPSKDSVVNQTLAAHVWKYLNLFCQDDQPTVRQVDYLDSLKSGESKDFVATYYSEIQLYVRKYLQGMYQGTFPVTHDFYLKEFQLTRPQLKDFTILLFDEGQDASRVMLDVFLRQDHATKLIVGDASQQIYSWRNAINSLEQVDFPTYFLTQSWRFGPSIARVANVVLGWKSLLGLRLPPPIVGKGRAINRISKATIARKNSTLLASAIEQLVKHRTIETVYFEGRFESYTFSDSGSSLYDILNLYLERPQLIRDPFIRSMDTILSLRRAAEQLDDKNLVLLITMVQEYGERLPYYLQLLKAAQVPEDQKEQADMCFGTVHKMKGAEFDEVTLLDDFLTFDELVRAIESGKGDLTSLNEEINILYVAITRAKVYLNLPPRLRHLWNTSSHRNLVGTT